MPTCKCLRTRESKILRFSTNTVESVYTDRQIMSVYMLRKKTRYSELQEKTKKGLKYVDDGSLLLRYEQSYKHFNDCDYFPLSFDVQLSHACSLLCVSRAMFMS